MMNPLDMVFTRVDYKGRGPWSTRATGFGDIIPDKDEFLMVLDFVFFSDLNVLRIVGSPSGEVVSSEVGGLVVDADCRSISR
jgi:hypothetical protein